MFRLGIRMHVPTPIAISTATLQIKTANGSRCRRCAWLRDEWQRVYHSDTLEYVSLNQQEVVLDENVLPARPMPRLQQIYLHHGLDWMTQVAQTRLVDHCLQLRVLYNDGRATDGGSRFPTHRLLLLVKQLRHLRSLYIYGAHTALSEDEYREIKSYQASENMRFDFTIRKLESFAYPQYD